MSEAANGGSRAAGREKQMARERGGSEMSSTDRRCRPFSEGTSNDKVASRIAKYLRYELSSGKRIADWSAAWRNWKANSGLHAEQVSRSVIEEADGSATACRVDHE